MVETAQGARLPIEDLADRVTARFVPVVLALSLATFALWLAFGGLSALPLALVSAVNVLIIACPCAMGLATPAALVTGTGRAAELGVIFRQGDALQTLCGVRTVAFDKTGTLTLGKPALTGIVAGEGFDEARLLSLAAAVEAQSEHPLGRALVEAAGRGGAAGRPGRGFRLSSGIGRHRRGRRRTGRGRLGGPARLARRRGRRLRRKGRGACGAGRLLLLHCCGRPGGGPVRLLRSAAPRGRRRHR